MRVCLNQKQIFTKTCMKWKFRYIFFIIICYISFFYFMLLTSSPLLISHFSSSHFYFSTFQFLFFYLPISYSQVQWSQTECNSKAWGLVPFKSSIIKKEICSFEHSFDGGCGIRSTTLSDRRPTLFHWAIGPLTKTLGFVVLSICNIHII